MSNQKTLKDIYKSIFLQGLEAGPSLSNTPDSQTNPESGPAPAPVNPFRWPGLERALGIKGICGLSSAASYASVNLQQSLENRLRQKLDVDGSPEYALTWKQWDMESGPPICALRARAHRISGKGCGGEQAGWPKTPSASDGEGGVMEIRPGTTGKYKLRDYAHMVLTTPPQSGGPAGMENGEGCRDGWRTPQVAVLEAKSSVVKFHGRKPTDPQVGLPDQAVLAGWKTPSSQEPGIKTNRLVDRDGNPWTPGQRAYDKETGRLAQTGMPQMAEAALAGYPTPNSNSKGGGEYADSAKAVDRYLNHNHNKDLKDAVHLFSRPDMTGWKLNPRFSLWLMGYPAEWACSGERAMQSIPKLRRRSPKRS